MIKSNQQIGRVTVTPKASHRKFRQDRAELRHTVAYLEVKRKKQPKCKDCAGIPDRRPRVGLCRCGESFREEAPVRAVGTMGSPGESCLGAVS